jgi:hypothetical protein
MWVAKRLFSAVRRLQARLAVMGAFVSNDPQAGQAEYNAFVDEFYLQLSRRPPGKLLEIGARNRTSANREPRVPSGWVYEGFDIAPDVWVTIIGDAHDLKAKIPIDTFDAVVSLATFEHLLMPWKVAIEINYVLRKGGLVLIGSHQTFPLHELPADYWRFSDQAWHALFNKYTGFRIIKAEMCRAASVVPRIPSQATASMPRAAAYLHSLMIAEKISDTRLKWEVDPQDISPLAYPD